MSDMSDWFERMQKDPARKPILDDYFRCRVFRLQWPVSGAQITFGEYADLRQKGEWNATAREHWPQFKGLLVESEPGPEEERH